MRIPKKLGERIDLMYTLQQQRLERQREMEEVIEKLKQDEQSVEDSIINEFTIEEISKVGGRIATATVTPTAFPQVKDWPKFYLYIKQNNAFDLLEKRPARVAFRERYEDGVKIPGVVPFIKKVISLRKIGK